jgi:hypothetical protein
MKRRNVEGARGYHSETTRTVRELDGHLLATDHHAAIRSVKHALRTVQEVGSKNDFFRRVTDEREGDCDSL